MIRLFVRTVVVSVLVCAPLHAEAQYFGRNKVEYENFDFRILATEHFDIYYYSQEEPAARLAARLAERWYARLSTVLNHTFDRRQPLVLYGSQAEFAQTNVVSGLLSDSIGGVTEGAKRRIVMPFAPTLAETDHVIGHELVHAFQFDISRKHGGATGQPLWFIEGMAEYLSKGPLTGASTLWARDAVLSGRLPEKMNAAARDLSPYMFGHAFWSYIGERFGDQSVERALKPGRKQRRLKDRIRHATGAELDEVYREWRAAMHEQYGDAREGRERYRSWDRGTMQIGPSVSPDGTRAVFFSERDRMSLDLFLADLDRKQVIRKVATTAASAKFDSLQPLRSAGTWSPDGRWFAFAAVRHGRAALQLIDVRDDTTPPRKPRVAGAPDTTPPRKPRVAGAPDTTPPRKPRVAGAPGRGDRELIFPTLGQVLSPTWSPDGASIAFSAIAGGWTDLYVADVASGALRRITNDAFADLQPAWSHDGRTIAFATERYSSDLVTLRIGSPRLALLDVGTNVIRPLSINTGGMQINPQWSKDDGELYFVGELDGIANVMRLCLETHAVHQITNVATAVAGITPTGPALSVSANERTLAFTIYANGRPHLTVLEPNEVLAGARSVATEISEDTETRLREDATAGQASSPGDLVSRALADYESGVSTANAPMVREYRPRLSLEGIGQPYLSSGGGPFGTFVRGGGALLFGDMLGERRLGAAVQIGNRLHDTAIELRYLNQERRWTWGGLAEVEPGIARFRTSSAVKFNGQEALLRQTEYFQRMQVRAAGLLAYPFSRGLRVEMFGGVRHAQYRRDQRVLVASAETGEIFDREQAEFSGGRPTTVAELGAALVRDTTVFGPTGPLLGSRYRVELAPAIGQLRYTSLLADVRHYLMPVRPFTVAMRMVHTGRYGRDGRDPRLLPSYLGSSYFVRGHREDLRYCTPDATQVCGDELLGNRLLVGNLEVRFPLLGMWSRQLEYRVVPIDAFFFADGGIVSGKDGRTSISSIGAGLRMNAGGLPLEVGAVRALDGPRPRWQFDLGFRVGF